MITKILRDEKEQTYNLKVTDKNGNYFTMMYGGNLDLYWVPANYKLNNRFEIDKSDSFVFGVFERLFDAISQNDDKYRPVLKDNTITFVSEEWAEEESNILKIEKNQTTFTITFIKNQNQTPFSLPKRGCPICFCNSGSRVPTVQSLFTRMFNYLAYNCDAVPIEQQNTPTTTPNK